MQPIEALSAHEQAAEARAKLEGSQLFWRYFGWAGLIAGTVGIAALVAHWTRT
jgi:hypothetical protein